MTPVTSPTVTASKSGAAGKVGIEAAQHAVANEESAEGTRRAIRRGPAEGCHKKLVLAVIVEYLNGLSLVARADRDR